MMRLLHSTIMFDHFISLIRITSKLTAPIRSAPNHCYSPPSDPLTPQNVPKSYLNKGHQHCNANNSINEYSTMLSHCTQRKTRLSDIPFIAPRSGHRLRLTRQPRRRRRHTYAHARARTANGDRSRGVTSADGMRVQLAPSSRVCAVTAHVTGI